MTLLSIFLVLTISFNIPANKSGTKIGILMINYGEPTYYNATTYYYFKGFMKHMINVGILPKFLMFIDMGTLLIDIKNDKRAPPWKRELMDAWENKYNGIAIYLPFGKEIGLYPLYIKKFGNGKGEPDIFEFAGLEAYDSWQKMGGKSPYYEETVSQMRDVEKMLKEKYGNKIIVKFAYALKPGSIENATKYLLDKDINVLIAAPQSVVGSYFEETLHWIKEIHNVLNEYALEKGKNVSFIETRHIGMQPEFRESIVAKVKEELTHISSNASVLIFLSNHGFPVVKCDGYDCQSDPYHHRAKEIFNEVKEAIIENITWQGKFDVVQIYDESSEEAMDPENEVTSPKEGLEYAKNQGFNYIIDIPYEFLGDCMDTLIGLREAFGIEPKQNLITTAYI